ncbi:MAG: hypothetical protein J3K34DRAFT_458571 [Monoraphidium minutum]|nr:MAG: hypothetical protein J3K34DRAFT_458571 [Monoraphidium minutum]
MRWRHAPRAQPAARAWLLALVSLVAAPLAAQAALSAQCTSVQPVCTWPLSEASSDRPDPDAPRPPPAAPPPPPLAALRPVPPPYVTADGTSYTYHRYPNGTLVRRRMRRRRRAAAPAAPAGGAREARLKFLEATPALPAPAHAAGQELDDAAEPDLPRRIQDASPTPRLPAEERRAVYKHLHLIVMEEEAALAVTVVADGGANGGHAPRRLLQGRRGLRRAVGGPHPLLVTLFEGAGPTDALNATAAANATEPLGAANATDAAGAAGADNEALDEEAPAEPRLLAPAPDAPVAGRAANSAAVPPAAAPFAAALRRRNAAVVNVVDATHGVVNAVNSVSITNDRGQPQGQLLQELTFLENAALSVGVDIPRGGVVGEISSPLMPPPFKNKNLINAWDCGRLMQQSYYGCDDGSCWAAKPWRWNPVQCGSWQNFRARALNTVVEGVPASRVATQSHPRNWGGQELITDVTMGSDYRLLSDALAATYSMTYDGAHAQPSRTQEVPAFFVDRRLGVLAFYEGGEPWTGGRLRFTMPGGTNNYYTPTEPWAAYVDADTGYGIGVFVPIATGLTAYRVGPDGSTRVSDTSYLALTSRFPIEPGSTFNYTAYVAVGAIADIRRIFTRLALEAGIDLKRAVARGGAESGAGMESAKAQTQAPAAKPAPAPAPKPVPAPAPAQAPKAAPAPVPKPQAAAVNVRPAATSTPAAAAPKPASPPPAPVAATRFLPAVPANRRAPAPQPASPAAPPRAAAAAVKAAPAPAPKPSLPTPAPARSPPPAPAGATRFLPLAPANRRPAVPQNLRLLKPSPAQQPAALPAAQQPPVAAASAKAPPPPSPTPSPPPASPKPSPPVTPAVAAAPAKASAAPSPKPSPPPASPKPSAPAAPVAAAAPAKASAAPSPKPSPPPASPKPSAPAAPAAAAAPTKASAAPSSEPSPPPASPKPAAPVVAAAPAKESPPPAQQPSPATAAASAKASLPPPSPEPSP